MIKKLWPVHFLHEEILPEVPPNFIKNLISIGEEYETNYPQAHYPTAIRQGPETSYNLIKDPRPEPQLLKHILRTRMIEVAMAEGFFEPEKVKFEAVTTLRKFMPNQYAKPHCHRSVDYVAVLFGNVKSVPRPKTAHQNMSGERLQLIDPMPSRNRLLNHKILYEMRPNTGTFVIHPASIFHTTELNLTDEPLIAFVSNIRVVEPVREYEEL